MVLTGIIRALNAGKKLNYLFILILFGSLLSACAAGPLNPGQPPGYTSPAAVINLPEPGLKGNISLEETLAKRRSIRDYTEEPLTLDEISQILWAAQGITSTWGGRTAPSAGALYPLVVYMAAGNVQSLSPGVYRYSPEKHGLVQVKDSDIREELYAAGLNQSSIKDGPVSFIIAAIYEKTTVKYGERGVRYVHLEAGHAAQNICLQVTSLALGAVTIGAFNDDQVKKIAGLSDNEVPLYIIPAGRPKS